VKKQIDTWKGDFGYAYTHRNNQTPYELDDMYIENFGFSRTDLNQLFVGNMSKKMKILEVGSNTCLQLKMLQRIGFTNLYGIEINLMSIEESKRCTDYIYNMYGEAADIPFKDCFFDLVFTTGLLIHIHPKEINEVLSEIYRCTKKYILCHEFFADEYIEVDYRGKEEILWKTNFCSLFLNKFPDLNIVKSVKLKYKDTDNIDEMFLLEK